MKEYRQYQSFIGDSLETLVLVVEGGEERGEDVRGEEEKDDQVEWMA